MLMEIFSVNVVYRGKTLYLGTNFKKVYSHSDVLSLFCHRPENIDWTSLGTSQIYISFVTSCCKTTNSKTLQDGIAYHCFSRFYP